MKRRVNRLQQAAGARIGAASYLPPDVYSRVVDLETATLSKPETALAILTTSYLRDASTKRGLRLPEGSDSWMKTAYGTRCLSSIGEAHARAALSAKRRELFEWRMKVAVGFVAIAAGLATLAKFAGIA
jgi:hypothetical protein